MERQLTLLDSPRAWRLDETTKAVARKGLAEARASLAAAKAAAARRAAAEAATSPAHRRRSAA